MISIAHGLKYFLGYPKPQFLAHYYSIYLYVTFLCFYPKMLLLITTPYSTGTGIHNIISDLEQASDILSNWFQDNYLKAIPTNIMCFSVKHLKVN